MSSTACFCGSASNLAFNMAPKGRFNNEWSLKQWGLLESRLLDLPLLRNTKQLTCGNGGNGGLPSCQSRPSPAVALGKRAICFNCGLMFCTPGCLEVHKGSSGCNKRDAEGLRQKQCKEAVHGVLPRSCYAGTHERVLAGVH